VGEIRKLKKTVQRNSGEDLGTGIEVVEGKQLAHDRIQWCGLSKCLSDSPL
jgi:hypothetical protein